MPFTRNTHSLKTFLPLLLPFFRKSLVFGDSLVSNFFLIFNEGYVSLWIFLRLFKEVGNYTEKIE